MDEDVQVRVLLFAKARELAGGATEVSLRLPRASNSSGLRASLELHLPALRSLGGAYVLALNEEYVDDDQEAKHLDLKVGDELAVIPPISGG